MIVSVMSVFSDAFESSQSENGIIASDIAGLRNQLAIYYNNDAYILNRPTNS
jgi:hypothetical protein